MSWTQHTIGVHVPEAIGAAADGADAIAGALDAVVGTAASLVDAASAFYGSTADPAASLVTSLVDEIATLVDDTFGTGVYMLVATPYNVGPLPPGLAGVPRLTPRTCITRMVASFDDQGDDDRPQFSDSANVAALGIMATAADATALITAVEALASLIDIPDLHRMIERARRDSGSMPHPSRSRPPDWRSVTMRSIPPFSNLYPALTGLLENLRSATVTADNVLSDLSSVMQKRVTRLATLAENLSSAIDAIVSAAAASGLYVLDIPPGTGGNERLKVALRDPELEGLSENGYTAAVLMVAGGPSVAGLESIKELFL